MARAPPCFQMSTSARQVERRQSRLLYCGPPTWQMGSEELALGQLLPPSAGTQLGQWMSSRSTRPCSQGLVAMMPANCCCASGPPIARKGPILLVKKTSPRARRDVLSAAPACACEW